MTPPATGNFHVTLNLDVTPLIEGLNAARAIMVAFAAGIEFQDGFEAGITGGARNWSRSEQWHRGHLHGRLQAFKEKWARIREQP